MKTETIQVTGPTTIYMGKEYPVWVKTRKGYYRFEHPTIPGDIATGIRLTYAGAIYLFTAAKD